MSHHGREGEREDYAGLYRKLNNAILLLQRVAERHASPGDVDAWLANNGYDCPTLRQRQREHQKKALDQKIAQLQAERAKLDLEPK